MLKDQQAEWTLSVLTLPATGPEVTTLTGVKCTRQQDRAEELVAGVGVIITYTYTFIFHPDESGDLPAITSNQIISDGTDRYEILEVLDLDYLNRLEVTTVKI